MVANPQPTYASFLGLGLEPSNAYGVAVNPTAFVPVKSMTPMDKLTLLTDEGWRGAPVRTYSHTPGPLYAEYEFGGDVFADVIGFPLAGLLGDVVYSGTYTGSGTGVLSTAITTVGATSFQNSVSIPSGTRIQIDTGVLAETVVTTGAPTGGGPFTIPVPALKNTHLVGSTVQPVQAPYASAMALLCSGNFQPPSYTLTDWNSNITGYQLPGARFSEVDLKFAGNGKLDYTAKATAMPTVVNGTKPTFSAPPTSIMPGWECIVKIGGTTVGYTVDADITLKRVLEVIDTADGSQAPYAIWAGEAEASGKMTIVMEDDSKRAAYVAGTSTAIEANFSQSTGATTQGVLLHATQSYLTDAKVVRGKSYAELEIAFECDANTSDVGVSGGYSPIKATVTNQLISGTYK